MPRFMERIEELLQKATAVGGLDYLLDSEKEELGQWSVLAEQYEDTQLKIMPLSVHNSD